MAQSGSPPTGENAVFSSLKNQTLEPESIENHPLPLVAGPALVATSTSLLPTPPVISPSWGHLASSSYFPAASDAPTFPPTEISVGATAVDTAELEQTELKREDTAKPEMEDPEEEVTSGHLKSDEESNDSRPFNLSEYGIVHLPPLPPSNSNTNSEGYSSKGSERYYSAGSFAGSRSGSQAGTSQSSGLRIKRRRPQVGNSSDDPSQSSSEPRSNEQSRSQSAGSEDASVNSLSSEEPLVTVSFQHKEDENGHHVIIGREGQLERCEDEPIHTPGAVQGFGVLIAVEEDIENNAFTVRQVSENSTELLGLPPKYLFGLECFTDALPDDQVDTFWDNLNFLLEPGRMSDEEKSSPHVFLLSGWGAPGSAILGDPESRDGRCTWSCWCAVHRAEGPQKSDTSDIGPIIIELELEKDKLNPLYPSLPETFHVRQSGQGLFNLARPSDNEGGSSISDGSTRVGSAPHTTAPSPQPPSEGSVLGSETPQRPGGLAGDDDWRPDPEAVIESTTSFSKPIPALERLRRMSKAQEDPRAHRRGRRQTGKGSAAGMMDVFAVMTQIDDQLGAAEDLDMFLKIVVGVVKDLTQFHKVMVYQFDEMWNGQVVAELVDWNRTHDLYRGLQFPAGDIPAQNMTHCYLRAMSPIHIQYLENMGVRASMSISITCFGQLWGLVACHSYGAYGMRVSFPVRQMLRLLSQSISKNIERLSYAQRLHTRKLVNTITSEQHPTGYIVSNADDLLGLFDADFGILVIGEGAKILGPNQNGQEILIMAEYLRLKQFSTIEASQAVMYDYPDLRLTTGALNKTFFDNNGLIQGPGLEVVAGLLYVPLSRGGRDFIAFLRRGQPCNVKWAGKPHKDSQVSTLEPRKSFKVWSETVAGRCRAWTDEQLETAGVLALVYGKFIEVWRQKESALQTTKLTNLILSNATHEVRTPLNHIINYLEMALNGSLDRETRENLRLSHAASKGLLFTINDLLDLTRLESGNETSFNEPFDLHRAIEEATAVYRREAERRQLDFKLEVQNVPAFVVGDSKKMCTVVQNLIANALKYTSEGSITVECTTYGEPEGLRGENQMVVQIVVADTGCGIEETKLESIFREFEQVESTESKPNEGVGLGLAVVARIVEQLGGQLRVDSTVGAGSRFSFLIPLSLCQHAGHITEGGSPGSSSVSDQSSALSSKESLRSNPRSGHSEIDGLVEALSSNHMTRSEKEPEESPKEIGTFPVQGSQVPVRGVKIDPFSEPRHATVPPVITPPPVEPCQTIGFFASPSSPSPSLEPPRLRVLIVEDNDINRIILGKRLSMNGHTIVNTTNGQEGLEMVEKDQAFDVVFMDIQMPILDGFEATQRIRQVEEQISKSNTSTSMRLSRRLNGRIPIFAISASLVESQKDELIRYGMDGWILKPVDFKRLNTILQGILDTSQRQRDVYQPGCNWESGGWLQSRSPDRD
ncbi:hypothetical protein EST38_g2993 [Candolleomyces aberdarensis]|uniref:Uncharacterized protein n=1 Tax=Candolleomyces aberdarensis TaxID=2316362 RepID=A0A4Q2DRM5_9AGAR|nr:hypothetical protein EST38_g2993 [Candolleomyces aberdarensis]